MTINNITEDETLESVEDFIFPAEIHIGKLINMVHYQLPPRYISYIIHIYNIEMCVCRLYVLLSVSLFVRENGWTDLHNSIWRW